VTTCPKCDQTLCPKCGAHAESGYGVAFGGGLGSYEWCASSGCEWYEKRHDREDEPEVTAELETP
jgi:hypothetical protein